MVVWEQKLEGLLFAARWLLAPIYMGLSLALVALGIKFFQELFHILPHILEASETGGYSAGRQSHHYGYAERLRKLRVEDRRGGRAKSSVGWASSTPARSRSKWQRQL